MAVAVGDLAPSGDDMTLIATDSPEYLPAAARLRAETGGHILASLEGFYKAEDLDDRLTVIGVLPAPLSRQDG